MVTTTKQGHDLAYLLKFKNVTVLENFMKHVSVQIDRPDIVWESPEDYHVTLVYVPDLELADAVQLSLEVQMVEPVDVQFDGFGTFSTARGDDSNILYMAVVPTHELKALQGQIFHDVISKGGVVPSVFSDPESWIPHITLAYAGDPFDESKFPEVGGSSIRGKRIEANIDFEVVEVSVEKFNSNRDSKTGRFTFGGGSGGGVVSAAASKSQRERYRVFNEDTKPKDQDSVVASQEKLTDAEELEVLNEYAADGFKTINPAARGDESATPEAIKQVETLEGALNKTEAPADMVVHRGVDMAFWGVDSENAPDVTDRGAYAQFMVDHIDNNLTGASYTDNSFLSTSVNQNVALEFAGHKSTGAMMEVRVPQGTKGAGIVHQLGGASTFANEREFLLQRGLKYEIVGSKRDFVGPNLELVPIMIVEVVPSE